MERMEPLILRSLLDNEPYIRRVLPYLNESYFLNRTEKLIFERIENHITKFNSPPTRETLLVDMDYQGAEEDTLAEATEYIDGTMSREMRVPDLEWMVKRTEDWCKEKAVHNAVMDVVGILDGRDKKRDKESIPKILQDALGVSFDEKVGHDYFDDADSRYDFYHKKDTKLPFHLDSFNLVTKNGIPNKTLNICLAGTNVGKSLFMCDLAANYLRKGKKVLYITLEMAEERIAERIDANLLDEPLNDLPLMSREVYKRSLERIHQTTTGQLIIKEYPTASAHAGHFRHLLNELRLKKNFKPDAIFIDYLNICASGRMKASNDMYSLVKSIAEELRGLAVEFNVPIWSATQMNRAGFNNADPDLTNTSESFGLPATADFMFALVNSDELKGRNQLLAKILKNRYGAVMNEIMGKMTDKFVIGIDRARQKLYEDVAIKQDVSGDLFETAVAQGIAADPADLEDDDGVPPWIGKEQTWKGKVAEPVFDIDMEPQAAPEVPVEPTSAFEHLRTIQPHRNHGINV